MYKEIMDLINKYQTIIIHRHINPDGDAYGSQLGLKRIIEVNFPQKQVFAVGDTNTFAFLGEVDVIDDTMFNNALSIIIDVSVKHLVSDHRFELSDHVLIIDHHLNSADCGDTVHIDSTVIASAQIITEFALTYELEIDEIAATRLLTGIVTDSGRFKYPNTDAKTFRIASELLERKADIQHVYHQLYTEDLNFKKLKGYFINNFRLTKNRVAYMKNDLSVKDKYGVTTFTVSRAMVNQMGDIKDVEIWANFTLNEENEVLCEFRSKRYSIVDIARKYGGGGHALACGCTITSFDDVDQVLQDFDQLIEDVKINGSQEINGDL